MVGIFGHIQTGRLILILNTFMLMAGCAVGTSSTIVKSPPGTTTTFILVRHAEKADLTPESPLSVAGQERARALADALAPLGVTAIYCPALRRNRETVQPLSEHLGLAVLTIPGWQLLSTRQFAQNFIQKALANHGGGVILWAGNSSAVGAWGSNLQELYQQLGGDGQGPRAYDDLFVIVVDDSGAINIQKRHFGKRR